MYQDATGSQPRSPERDEVADSRIVHESVSPPSSQSEGSHSRTSPGSPAAAAEWVSVLFATPSSDDRPTRLTDAADITDLALNQVLATIIDDADRDELLPYFLAGLRQPDDVRFRHEVWRDLEDASLVESLAQFAAALHQVDLRLQWSRDTRFNEERLSWYLDAALRYCHAIAVLYRVLEGASPRSRGLTAVRDYLSLYTHDPAFVALRDDATAARHELDQIRYSLTIRGATVRVGVFGGDDEYAAEIRALFERFNQGGATTTYRVAYRDSYSMNHIEAAIANRVAKLFPDAFATLTAFESAHGTFVTSSIRRLASEFKVYTSYHQFMKRFQPLELDFSLPEIVSSGDGVEVHDAFDVALANKLVRQSAKVVTNSFRLGPTERVIVVSGPNQGGKTTFARMVGQVYYLAARGLPVPGSSARLSLVDEVFTHFSRAENNTMQAGKLEQDLVRMKAILRRATSSSVVIANEVFSSTTVSDAVTLGTLALQRCVSLGCRCVYVTFVDELSRLDPAIISMVSTIDPVDATIRTFKILPRPADGRAYALVIAEKYDLTYDQIRARVGS